jgi:3-deoxy-D-manno-octulosonate 8-phosphate phosphatase (KDO 8-P phosphatase)
MENNYKKLLKDITTFILDVDGVMTNGKIIYTHDGKIDRQFEAKDGYAIKHAISKGYNFVIISGGTQHNIEKRLNSLGVKDVFLSAFDKLKIFNDYISKKNISPDNILFMGDDNPDIEVLKAVKIGACPSDASVDVKEVCNYISDRKGGQGCVRDVIEQVMRIHNKWI